MSCSSPVASPLSETLSNSDPQHVILGDASSNTLTFSGTGVRSNRSTPVRLPAVLAALQPSLRMVALLRNPVDRLYSAFHYYGHYAKQHGADAAGFHSYALAQLAAFAELCPAGRPRSDCAVAAYGRCEQLAKGLYSAFLPDYWASFTREQLLVLRSEEYGRDLEGSLAAVLAHVGLQQPSAEVWERMLQRERSNSRKQAGAARGGAAGEMAGETRRLLTEFYAPWNAELAGMLGDERYLRWNSPDAEEVE